MQEQIFTVKIEYSGDHSTQVIKDWLKEKLAGKVTRYVGMVIENYGGTISGRVIQASLRFINNEELSVKMLENYLADTPATFKIVDVAKR